MDKDFIYRQTLVWLEHEEKEQNIEYNYGVERSDLAQSLTDHLWNNWQMVERANEWGESKDANFEGTIENITIIGDEVITDYEAPDWKRKPAP